MEMVIDLIAGVITYAIKTFEIPSSAGSQDFIQQIRPRFYIVKTIKIINNRRNLLRQLRSNILKTTTVP